MGTLYVVRHGQTDWNAEGRLQGASDIPLNAHGREQARRNGQALRVHLTDATALSYTASPLQRASETLSIVRRELGLEANAFERDARLMEARFGQWEGRLMRDIAIEDPDAWQAARGDRWNTIPPGAEGTTESLRMLATRVEGFLEETFHGSTGGRIIATHGGVMRVIRVLFGETPAERIGTLETPQDRVMAVRDGTTISWI